MLKQYTKAFLFSTSGVSAFVFAVIGRSEFIFVFVDITAVWISRVVKFTLVGSAKVLQISVF